jgi:hypothetical protein
VSVYQYTDQPDHQAPNHTSIDGISTLPVRISVPSSNKTSSSKSKSPAISSYLLSDNYLHDPLPHGMSTHGGQVFFGNSSIIVAVASWEGGNKMLDVRNATWNVHTQRPCLRRGAPVSSLQWHPGKAETRSSTSGKFQDIIGLLLLLRHGEATAVLRAIPLCIRAQQSNHERLQLLRQKGAAVHIEQESARTSGHSWGAACSSWVQVATVVPSLASFALGSCSAMERVHRDGAVPFGKLFLRMPTE